MRLVILLSVLVVAWGWPEEDPLLPKKIAHFDKKEDLTKFKLPGDVVPSHYELNFDVTLEPDFTFAGKVIIDAVLTKETDKIVLHSDGLTIGEAIVTLVSNGSSIKADTSHDEVHHFLTLQLSKKLAENENITISINYNGTLATISDGFYRAKYVNSDNKEVWMASTQFEATYARTAFPCFDEPAYKATFSIKITRPNELNTVTNTPLLESQPVGTKTQDIFETTTTMSTYLIAFMISDFKVKESTDKKHQVYARPDQIDAGNAEYALSLSEKTMRVLEKITGIPNYENKKMSQLAIPSDYFASGAMENWGAVTYKELYLMYDEDVSTSAIKETITRIVAHEYVHQWFGNLVSPQWWTYLWLNEGFATYFQYMIGHTIDPSFRFNEQIVTASSQRALREDIYDTRPMSYEVASRDEIENIFDTITYQKAGAVIRMMVHFLGDSVFFQGIRSYLEEKKFSAATEDDLFGSMVIPPSFVREEATIDVTEIMKKWTGQPGYPVVNVSRQNDGKIIITQERFLSSKENDTTIWPIPITYTTSDQKTPKFEDTTTNEWLREKTMTLSISLEEGKWIILNNKAVGYYRVNYDEYLWKRIICKLTHDTFTEIPPVNRAQLIDDAFNLALNGKLSIEILMNLLEYINKETDYIPLYSYFQNNAIFLEKVYGIQRYEQLQEVARNNLKTVAGKLGTAVNETEDTPIVKMGRNMALYWLCYLQDENCKTKMRESLLNDKSIHPDLQEAVYCGGARSESDKTFAKLQELYKAENKDLQKKMRIAKGMGCAQDETAIRQILNGTIKVEKADEETVKLSIFSNYPGLDVAVSYYLEEVDKLNKEELKSNLERIVPKIYKSDQIEKVGKIIDKLTEYPEVQKNLRKILDNNKNWIGNYGKKVDMWIDTYVTPSSASSITSNLSIFAIVGYFLLNRLA